MIGVRSLRAAVIAALCCLPGAAPAGPGAVVSMNLCTDQLAMLLAAPGQLRSVSHLAANPRSSAMAEAARAYPRNRGQAEEVYLQRPDLVLAGTYTTRATVDMLRRLNIEVVEFAPAGSLEGVRDRVRQMGDVLGREAEAAALLRQFDEDLAAARASGPARPRTALYHANGYTLGEGTLAHEVVGAAGLANLAVELGHRGGGRLPLEQLVLATPDLVVIGDDEAGASLADETLTHPALTLLRGEAPAAPVADSNWVCGTPFIISAIQKLSAARDAVLRRR